LAEATYDTLLDKFSEINSLILRVKQTSELDDALAKIAALAARNEHLEAENNELKLKLSNNINIKEPARQDNFSVIEAKIAALAANNERLESEVNQLKLSKSMPVESTLVQPEFNMNTYVHKPALTTSLSWSQISTIGVENTTNEFFDNFTIAYDYLNTEEVGRQLKQLLDAHCIDYYTFATSQLQVTKTGLNQLMLTPKNWTDLNEKERLIYRRMQKWTRATRGEIEELKQSLHMKRLVQNARVNNSRWATLRLNKK
jgi:hypothetical protein